MVTVNPDQYSQPIGPERPAQKQVDPDQYPNTAGPTREDYEENNEDAKKAKFDKEQEEWNQKHIHESRAREYEEEQKKIVESRKMKSFGQAASEKVGNAAGNAAQAGWGALKTQLKKPLDVRERNQQKMQEPKKPQPASKSQQKKTQSRGQFHPPGSGGFPGGKVKGSFPDIDPFGGMGGGGRGMALPKAGPNVFNVMGTNPEQKPTGKNQHQFPPKQPQRAVNFGDPFKGLGGKTKKISPLMNNPVMNPVSKPKKAAVGKRATPKTKKMRSWLDF